MAVTVPGPASVAARLADNPAPELAVRIDGVAKTYVTRKAEIRALAPIDLSIERGGFVALVGRSGCGKSTLLKLIAGLTAPSAGEVRVGGRRVDGPPPGVRYVFQDYGESLLPWKTVRANVEFGLRHGRTGAERLSRRRRAELADQHLAQVGLEHAGDRLPGELSGGMQQRVAIARALASEPSVLLLDEPFGAIDALSRGQLQDVVQRVWLDSGVTVVLVTHDIDEALYLADRAVVLGPDGEGVVADLAVGLDRPRTQMATREAPEFLALRRRLFDLVVGEGAR